MKEKLNLIYQAKLDEISKIAKVLANSTRVQILYLLEQSELNVSELTDILNIEQSNVSHQLQRLRDYQLISQKRKGKSIYYSLDDPHIITTLNQLMNHVDHILLGRKHNGQLIDNTCDVDD